MEEARLAEGDFPDTRARRPQRILLVLTLAGWGLLAFALPNGNCSLQTFPAGAHLAAGAPAFLCAYIAVGLTCIPITALIFATCPIEKVRVG